MYSPCSRFDLLAQRLLYAAVRVGGPAILPGTRTSWQVPVEEENWQLLTENWRETVGPWDAAALYRRPSPTRTGFSLLLLRSGRSIGFVRVTQDPRRVEHEFMVMRGLHDARPESFAVANPLAWGSVGSLGWLATESVPNYPLGAVRHTGIRHRVANEIGDILSTVLDRPAGAPSYWRPGHGDLAPWNLRTVGRKTVQVIDWEDAAYSPPGTDLLYGDLTAWTTFGTSLPRRTSREAASWVGSQIAARRQPDEDASSTNNRLLAALARIPVA